MNTMLKYAQLFLWVAAFSRLLAQEATLTWEPLAMELKHQLLVDAGAKDLIGFFKMQTCQRVSKEWRQLLRDTSLRQRMARSLNFEGLDEAQITALRSYLPLLLDSKNKVEQGFSEVLRKIFKAGGAKALRKIGSMSDFFCHSLLMAKILLPFMFMKHASLDSKMMQASVLRNLEKFCDDDEAKKDFALIMKTATDRASNVMKFQISRKDDSQSQKARANKALGYLSLYTCAAAAPVVIEKMKSDNCLSGEEAEFLLAAHLGDQAIVEKALSDCITIQQYLKYIALVFAIAHPNISDRHLRISDAQLL